MTPIKLLKKFQRTWRKLGPGLITGASDDDPSGIATYSQAGAAFGLYTLWTAFITYPFMFIIQEMCARIGIVNSTGLTGVLKKHYPPIVLYLMIFLMTPAIIFNIAADLAGMGAVVQLLIPSVPAFLASAVLTILVMAGMAFFCYTRIAAVMKWFCMALIVYLIVPFLVKQDWKEVAFFAIVPHIQFSKEFISILVAILGTTISPYLFFWQTSISLEDKQHKVATEPTLEIQNMKMDVNAGMFISNLVMFFIILTTGSVLFPAGVKHIENVETAARALEPLAGELAYLLFAIGVIGTGLLAIPVLAGCLAYIFAELFNWKKGMDKTPREAPGFYAIMFTSSALGLSMNVMPINPIDALIFTAIVYGLIAPVCIAMILHICNNQKVMGKFVNDRLTNILGVIAVVLMSLAAIALLVTSFF